MSNSNVCPNIHLHLILSCTHGACTGSKSATDMPYMCKDRTVHLLPDAIRDEASENFLVSYSTHHLLT